MTSPVASVAGTPDSLQAAGDGPPSATGLAFIVTPSDYQVIDHVIDSVDAPGLGDWVRIHFGPKLKILYSPKVEATRVDTADRSVIVLGRPVRALDEKSDNASVTQFLFDAFAAGEQELDTAFRSFGGCFAALFRYGAEVWIRQDASANANVSGVPSSGGQVSAGGHHDFLERLAAATNPAALPQPYALPGVSRVKLTSFKNLDGLATKEVERSPRKAQSIDILLDRGLAVGTVLDVGVLTGTFELKAAFSEARHVLFEPVAEFAEAIHKGYSNIDYELFQVALGDEIGEVKLRTLARLEGMDISHSTMDFGEKVDGSFRIVPMTTLDDVVGSRSFIEPFLLKIDIDGHEMRVLRGATDTLKRTVAVIVECTHQEIGERIIFLQKAGFRLFDLSEPCYYDKAIWQCDAVFIRNDVFNRCFTDFEFKISSNLYEVFK